MTPSSPSSYLYILRNDPQSTEELTFQAYRVPFREGSTVMDALRYIYENLDPSLAFRSSCQAGLCMACLMRIDGRVDFACRTYLRPEMKLEPLPGRRLIRDLVVELEENDSKS